MASVATKAGTQEASPQRGGVGGQTPTEGDRCTSRRRLLALLGAGGAALFASQLGREDALAGHDNTNVMHLGEQNIAPPGSITQINGNVAGPTLVLHNDNPSGGALQADQPVNISVDVDGDAVFVDNQNAGETAGGISVTARGGAHAVEGVAYPSESFGPGFGVRGISSLDGGYGDGPGVGVHGQSGTGVGVLGISTATGTGVEGSSDSGVGGHFSTNSGRALQVDGPASINVNINGAALIVDNGSTDPEGHGINAFSRAGPAVQGVAFANPEVEDSFAVLGVSSLPDSWGDGPGVGVQGLSGTGTGVVGYIAAGTGTGVEGHSDSGIGVNGNSDSGVGGHFSSNSGTALAVEGKAVFSTVGSAVIPAFQDSGFVSNQAVTGESHISATLAGNPGPVITGFPAVIQWVERRPGLGFVLHLTRRVGQVTPFTYLIVEPG